MKKRYQVTLTEETVNRFQSLCTKLKLPKSTMSSMIDDNLITLVDNMEKWVAQGKVSMVDLFTLVGEQFDKAIKEEESAAPKRSKKPTEKREKKEKAGN